MLALAVVELFVFARLSLDHFDLEQAVNPGIKQFLEQHPGDYRIANLDYPNTALSLRAQEVWGYEPGVVLRYAELLAFTDGLRPDQAVMLTTSHNAVGLDNPLLNLLRCRFLFDMEDGYLAIHERTNYLPHVLFVQRCRVLRNRGQIFSTLTNAAFNPRQEVILETPPDPAPVVSSKPGSVRLTDASTDFLDIEADLPSAAILLIPDVYAKGWRARGLPGSSQSHYQVQPGDWCLRAIPLAAGHHHLRLEYAPLGFRVGRWVSLIFLPVFLVLLALTVRRFIRRGGLALGWTSLRRQAGAWPGSGRPWWRRQAKRKVLREGGFNLRSRVVCLPGAPCLSAEGGSGLPELWRHAGAVAWPAPPAGLECSEAGDALAASPLAPVGACARNPCRARGPGAPANWLLEAIEAALSRSALPRAGVVCP